MMVEFQNRKKANKSRSFHVRYLELCRSRNFAPSPDVKSKNKQTAILDFFGDKLKIEDWLLIIESLYYDITLRYIGIRLRKNLNNILDHIDSDKKARMYRSNPVIFTKFIFTGVIEAICNCVTHNKNLTTLVLEGLPILEKYSIYIAKALSSNDSLQSISFSRSSIGDKGCEDICSTIKHLPNIECINMSQCELTTIGATSISDVIKFQKICRYTEGWVKSLRYRDVDPDTIPGLKQIIINRNPEIKDGGLQAITEILKDDSWIKVVEMENCGLTDTGATHVLQCLDCNSSIVVFNIRNNNDISEQMMKNLKKFKSTDDYVIENGTNDKNSSMKIREKVKILEEQIATETFRRQQMENLNSHLHEQIVCYEKQLQDKPSTEIPQGYTLIEQNELDIIVKERDDLRRTLASIRSSAERTYTKKHKIRRAKSEITAKFMEHKRNKQSSSEHRMSHAETSKYNVSKNSVFVEKGIGDSKTVNVSSPCEREVDLGANCRGIEALQVFMTKKPSELNKNSAQPSAEIAAKSLFMGLKPTTMFGTNTNHHSGN